MKLKTASLLLLAILVLNGCSSRLESRNEPQGNGGASYSQPTAKEQTATSSNPQTATTDNSNSAPDQSAVKTADYKKASSNPSQDSMGKTDAAKASDTAVERKIIRNASLMLESNAPADGQRKVASIAEAHGGFVVT